MSILIFYILNYSRIRELCAGCVTNYRDVRSHVVGPYGARSRLYSPTRDWFISTHIKILHTRHHYQSQLECCGLILKEVITKTITRVLWTVR